MSNSPRLVLPYVASGTAAEQKHNDGVNDLDALVCGNVQNRTTTSPPVATEGDCYVVGPSPSGVWTGKANYIAQWVGGQWNYIAPKVGMVVWCTTEDAVLRYVGTAWIAIVGESIFSGYNNANQAIAAGWNQLLFNVETRNDSGVYTHSTGSNQDQITLGEAGEYDVRADVTFEWVATNAEQLCEVRLTLNGGAIAGSSAFTRVSNVAGAIKGTCSVGMVINASASDVLRVEGQLAAGGGTIRTLAGGVRVIVRRV